MSSTEPLDDDQHDSPPEDTFESWDAFWAEVEREDAAERGEQATEEIRGVTVQVPHDLPLLFERKLDQLKGSDEDGFKQLLSHLFGADVLDAWVANGMKDREFETVFAWGYSHGKGRPITFRQAYEVVKARGDGAGKAGTGSAQTSDESESTGSSSKRTSRGNTTSRRRRSGA